MPESGAYVEVFNSDAEEFGGSGVTNAKRLLTEDFPWHNRSHSITLTVPPLATIFLKRGANVKPKIFLNNNRYTGGSS